MDLQFGVYYFTMYFIVDIDVVASEFYLLTIYPFFYQGPSFFKEQLFFGHFLRG